MKRFLFFGFFSGLVTFPYSIYLGTKVKKNPNLRSMLIKKMLGLPVIPAILIGASAYKTERSLKILSNKYFEHLTDHELDNFDYFYRLYK
jgi:membrane protein DedA with SNARE-associated domain